MSTRKLIPILIIICIVMSGRVSAAWTYLTEGYLGHVYLDFETLKKKMNL